MRNAADERPRALLVTRNFPPLVGGMERVSQKLLEAMARRGEAGLCGPAGCAGFAPTAAYVTESPLRPLPAFLLSATVKALSSAWRRRPQAVVAGSGLTAPIAWLCARGIGARAFVYLHGLDIIASNRVYQALWLPFIRRCDHVFVNSAHTQQLAFGAGVPADRIQVLHPGTDVPPFDLGARQRFRSGYALGDRPLLLSVGRLTRRKGLAEFVEHALPSIVARMPDALLLIVGAEASDALNRPRETEQDRIQTVAAKAGLGASLKFVGRMEELQLRDAYQAADCHVFPVLELPGDVEGFGMVALESAANALPTVAFAVGGVPDAVSDGTTGRLVAAGDYAGFAEGVLVVLSKPRSAAGIQACRDFAVDKDWDRFGDAVVRALGEHA
jgi:phosphatidylinositol alpha-1,6-mannosyltransferase